MDNMHLSSADLVRLAQEFKIIRSRIDKAEDIILQAQLDKEKKRHDASEGDSGTWP